MNLNPYESPQEDSLPPSQRQENRDDVLAWVYVCVVLGLIFGMFAVAALFHR